MNGASTTGLLIALGVLVTVGVLGSVLAPDKTTEILGFSGLIAASLMSILVQVYNAREQKKEFTDQKENLKDIKTMGVRNHVLLNSNMAIQLKSNAELSRWKADQTKKPEDIAAADAAERMHKEHSAKQLTVDEMDARRKAIDDDSQLTIKEGESAQVTITKTDADSK